MTTYIKSSAEEIQASINTFVDGFSEIQKQQFDKVFALLKDLSLDSDGNIKPTLSNLKIIDKVKRQLETIVNSPVFQDKIESVQDQLTTVQNLQTRYYSATFKDFTEPKTMAKIKDLTYENVVDGLAGAGIQAEVISVSAGLVEQHIRNGSSFSTMVDELKVQMLGNPKTPSRLISYAKQILTDTMSSFARNYHVIVTNDLELEWGVYVGALVATSRPMCDYLVPKYYIHKSELAGIARGIVDGKFIGTQGFMPDTTAQNFQFRCCGFFCEHQLVPVPSSTVPQELRDKYEKK